MSRAPGPGRYNYPPRRQGARRDHSRAHGHRERRQRARGRSDQAIFRSHSTWSTSTNRW